MKLVGDIRAAFRIGLVSARVNRLSFVVLLTFTVLLALAYFCIPCVRSGLEPLRHFMEKNGASAAFLSMVVFAGLIPWIFFLIDRSIRPEYPGWTGVVQVLWRSVLCVACFWLYRAQDALFGSGADVLTLLKKTAVDQFIWTPLFLSPLDSLFYFWLGRDFSFRRCRDEWPRDGFVSGVMLPNLLSGWCISIPTNVVVYMFPLDLRILVMGLIGSFWTLVCLQIGRRSGAVISGSRAS